jgi:hypothetical protein
MSTWLFSFIVVSGSALGSVAVLILIRKFVKQSTLRAHNELAGDVLAVVGTLNAVLLGLVILEAQSRYQQARTNEATESANVGDIRLYGDYLPEPTRGALNRHVNEYIKLVKNEEWDLPAKQQPDRKAVKEFFVIWKLVCSYSPTTSKEQNLQQSMLNCLGQAFDLRRFRITTARHGLPAILWVVLIACSVTTVLCTCLLATESLIMHAVMVLLLSITLSLGILLVSVLGTPYAGDWKIRPEQYERLSTGRLPNLSDVDPYVTTTGGESEKATER